LRRVLEAVHDIFAELDFAGAEPLAHLPVKRAVAVAVIFIVIVKNDKTLHLDALGQQRGSARATGKIRSAGRSTVRW